MPLGNIPFSARVSTLLGLENSERRTIESYQRESYQRELAEHRSRRSSCDGLLPATRRCCV